MLTFGPAWRSWSSISRLNFVATRSVRQLFLQILRAQGVLEDIEVERVVETDALQADAGDFESAAGKLGLTRIAHALTVERFHLVFVIRACGLERLQRAFGMSEKCK